jgi:uncharacterized damage-inducible protein DinB
MDLKDFLIKRVEYEAWANQQWLTYFESAPNKPGGAQFAAKGEQWMKHICGSYRGWMNGLLNEKFRSGDDVASDLELQYQRIRDFIAVSDLDEVREVTFAGYRTYRWALVDVIHHFVNHGTYHRGHLRALAEEAGLKDWPDTDISDFSGIRIK